VTTFEKSSYLSTGQVTHYNVTTFEKSSYFSHWAGNPLQMWPLAKPFSRFILHRAGRLEQFDHSRNPFRVLFFLSGRSPGTIWPLAKPFSHFILHRAGRLEQLDHSRNSSRSFIIGQVAQNNLVHLTKKNNSKKKKKKWVVFQMTCFLISTSLCKGCVSIYCFQGFQGWKKKKKQRFFLYLLFFINLLHKAIRKWNFPISLHSKYHKEGATVITQFLTILF
jgi:hypothetical protein